MEQSTGVRGEVRARSHKLRRERLLKEVDDAEEELGKAIKHQRLLRRDYLEVRACVCMHMRGML